MPKNSKTINPEAKAKATNASPTAGSKAQSAAKADAQVNTYSGGCHCGKVRYQVSTDLGMVIACNCSICSKRGSLLNFVPASQFELQKGEAALTDYQFNKHLIHHLFCSTCGILSFARGKGKDGKEMIAVNVRCLDDLDLDTLKITNFDGRSL